MPVLPSSIINLLFDQFAALIPPKIDTHPLRCHRPRISDRIVFDKLIQILVLGAAYDKIADATCSATTIRRRRDEWITAGIFEQLEQICLEFYDRIVGLELDNLSVDGCIVKAPCGGESAGRSPVDRGKQGTKRSLLVDGKGIPVGCVIAGANQHDPPLLAPTLDKLARLGFHLPEQITVHLDAGYDSQKTRNLLKVLGCGLVISTKGEPLQAGARWVIERTNSWHNRGRQWIALRILKGLRISKGCRLRCVCRCRCRTGGGRGGFFGLLTSAGGAAGDEERRCKGEKAYGLDVTSKYFRVSSQDYLRFIPAVRCVMGVLVLVRTAD